MTLLYQSGYLSIDLYDAEMRTYWLHFPNEEVRIGMVGGLSHTVVHSDEMDEYFTKEISKRMTE